MGHFGQMRNYGNDNFVNIVRFVLSIQKRISLQTPVITQIWGKTNYKPQIGLFWGKMVMFNYSLLPQ